MKIKNIVPVVLLLTLCFLQSQAKDEKGLQQEKAKLYGKIYYLPLGLDGSPYLHEEWETGDINLVNGDVAYDIKIRLNIIENDLVFYNEELFRVFTIDKNMLSSFTMREQPGAPICNFIKYTGEEIGFRLQKNDLIEVLYEGNISLYVKHLADVIDSNDLNSKSKVYPKEFYFLKIGETIVEVRDNARSVLKYFPENKREIKKIIVANNLRKRNEHNLLKLVRLMDADFGSFSFEP